MYCLRTGGGEGGHALGGDYYVASVLILLYVTCVRVVVVVGVTLWGGLVAGALEIPDRCFRTSAPNSPGTLNPEP